MSYSLPPYVHAIIMHNQLILLNERNDSYTILSEYQTKIFLEENGACDKHKEISEKLARMKLIEPGHTHLQNIKIADKNYEGIDNYTWRTNRITTNKRPCLLLTARACKDLTLLKFQLKRKGLENTLNKMRHSKKNAYSENISPPPKTGISDYAHAIQAASLILPFKVKCLESSICVFNYAIQSGKKCDFFIGVQLFDFLSHAWIEVDGDVILDDKDLSQKIPKILSI